MVVFTSPSSPPYGVPILNSHKTSAYPTRLSSFNCSGRLTLGPNPPEPLSVHLGYCEYSTFPPPPCQNHDRDVAVACLEPMKVETSNTLPPVTFAPVTCEFSLLTSTKVKYYWSKLFRLPL